MKKLLVFAGVFGCVSVLLTGCARNISASSYDARTLSGPALNSYPGTVVSIRRVVVENGDSLEDNQTGAILGAAAGGLGGNMIGQGKGRAFWTGVGALAGGVAGAYAEKNLKAQEAYEYVIRLDDGRMKTVVQGVDTFFPNGARVILIEGDKGRSRLIAG